MMQMSCNIFPYNLIDSALSVTWKNLSIVYQDNININFYLSQLLRQKNVTQNKSEQILSLPHFVNNNTNYFSVSSCSQVFF